MSENIIRIIEDFKGYSEDKVCFRTGAKPEIVTDNTKWAFEHVGPEYSMWSPSSIQMFQERILLGQEMPRTMIVNQEQTIDVAAAALIFKDPSSLLDTQFNALITSIDIFSRYGHGFLAHTPVDHTTVIRGFNQIAPAADDSLRKGISILEGYRNGHLPDIPPPPKPDGIEEKGPIVWFKGEAETWQMIWAQGYTSGIRFGEKAIEVVNKSTFVPHLNILQVAEKLNQMETSNGGRWDTDGTIATIRQSDTSLSQNDIIEIVTQTAKTNYVD